MRIERRSALSRESFLADYLRPGRPVICTDAMARWDGDRIWTPKGLMDLFGGWSVPVYNDLFDLQDITTLQDYFDKCWHNPATSNSAHPAYVRWYAQLKDSDFVWADKAFAILAQCWTMPYFLPDRDYLLPRATNGQRADATIDAFPAKGLFISAAGIGTRLHHDPWASDAVLCQMYGRKRIRMHPSGGTTSRVGEEGFDDVLEPGEIAYFPHGWEHQVDTLQSSISITWNFVHASQWQSFFAYLLGPISDEDREILRFFAER